MVCINNTVAVFAAVVVNGVEGKVIWRNYIPKGSLLACCRDAGTCYLADLLLKGSTMQN
ncbi:MAG: hypothetical protein H8D65_02550 [Spirochaetes bacterium]|nr:hypothetical protein [Spirochaetota bacterium]MBL7005640.1 hypothetical protein [Spirochaetia bacterium]